MILIDMITQAFPEILEIFGVGHFSCEAAARNDTVTTSAAHRHLVDLYGCINCQAKRFPD